LPEMVECIKRCKPQVNIGANSRYNEIKLPEPTIHNNPPETKSKTIIDLKC